MSIKPKKYWYRTDIYACVLCGRETKYRQRVYKKEESATYWHDDSCAIHFM